MNNTLKNIIVTLVVIGLVITGIVFYSRNQKLNKAIDNEVIRQNNIDRCLDTVYENYTNDWNDNCIDLGYGTGCRLASSISDRLDKAYKDASAMCVARY